MPSKGVVRFHLSKKAASIVQPSEEQSLELDGILQTATRVAAEAKQGLVGDFALGMLIGSHIGTSGGPVGQRILTVRFEAASGQWRAYDGTLLAWAKQHLIFDSA